FKATPEAHRQMLNQFIETVNTGEMDGLMKLLSHDVTLWADGGGKARGAALHPLSGREAIARFVLFSTRLLTEGMHYEISEVNREPTIIVRVDGHTFVVLSVEVDQGLVSEIRAIGNPDKLKWVSESPNPSGNEEGTK